VGMRPYPGDVTDAQRALIESRIPSTPAGDPARPTSGTPSSDLRPARGDRGGTIICRRMNSDLGSDRIEDSGASTIRGEGRSRRMLPTPGG
jgi:hypothetical protein